jgi:hypothetical protein
MKPSKIASVMLAATLLAAPALAADRSAPLPAGKPAGAQKASLTGEYAPFLYIGIFAAAAAIIATTAGSGSLTPSAQSTGTTS